MKGLKVLLKIEFSKLNEKKHLYLIFAVSIILFLFLNSGRVQYRDYQNSQTEFKLVESARVKEYLMVEQYAGYGIRVLSLPPAISILTGFHSLQLSINIAEKFNINIDARAGHSQHYNYLYVFLFIGCILAMVYGGDDIQNIKFQRFLLFYFGRQYLLYTLIARIIVFTFVFSILHLVMLLYLLIFDLNLFTFDSFALYLGLLVTFGFFLLLGAYLSLHWSKNTGMRIVLTFFFFLVLIPSLIFVIGNFLEQKPKSVELENLRLTMNLESKLHKQFGSNSRHTSKKLNPAEIKKMMDMAIANHFAGIQNNERKVNQSIQNNLFIIGCLKTLSPIASMDYFRDSKNRFPILLKYGEKLKRQFIEYYARVKEMNLPKEKGVLPEFFKADENVFLTPPMIPDLYWIGLMVTLFHILVIGFLIGKRQKRIYTGTQSADIVTIVHPTKEIVLPIGTIEHFCTKDETILNYFYHVLMGNYQIIFDETHNYSDYFYIPTAGSIPLDNIALGAIGGLNPSFTKDMGKTEIMLRIASTTGKIVFADNCFEDLEEDEMERIKGVIQRKELRVLHIGRDLWFQYADNIVFSATDDSIKAGSYFKAFQDQSLSVASG